MGGNLVGKTAFHNRLACLLAKVLVQDCSNPEALSLLLDIESDGLFNPAFSRTYSLKRGPYGYRGGRPYFKPRGWLRFAICQECFNEDVAQWCVAYHGCGPDSIASILLRGLQRPGDA